MLDAHVLPETVLKIVASDGSKSKTILKINK